MVLIETYWNVNFLEALYTEFDKEVLIETYWNVNSGADKYMLIFPMS